MKQAQSQQDQITFSVQLHKTLTKYIKLSKWTPAMGALLLSGVHPSRDCVDIPVNGGIGLDNEPLTPGSSRFHEARKIFKVWNDWWDEDNWEDKVIPPTELTPMEFIDWFVENQIHEYYAIGYEFNWVPAFKELVGYPSGQVNVPFDVALYATRTSESIDLLLNKINQADVASSDGSHNPPATSQSSKQDPNRRKPRRFRGPMAEVLKLAEKKANDPDDHSSVWAALVDIARGTKPPFPIIKYINDNWGIRIWQDENNQKEKFFTKEDMRKRIRRIR